MNINDLKALLKDSGWTFFPSDHLNPTGVDWRASFRTVGLPDCLCNERSPQLVLTPWVIEHHDEVQFSVKVSICGETPSGWVDLEAYNLPLDMEAIAKACNAIKSAWSAAAAR